MLLSPLIQWTIDNEQLTIMVSLRDILNFPFKVRKGTNAQMTV